LNSERSLVGAIIPPQVAHVNAVESVAFQSDIDLLNSQALLSSVIYDFLIKSNGRLQLFGSSVANLPWAQISDEALVRVLRLNCLTNRYADLWNRNAKNLSASSWSSSDFRLTLEGPLNGPESWDYGASLRTEFARRMALVEIDVLVAQALSLTLNQLIEIYRIYFPVLQENEAGTWYDQNGRIVWTCSKGLPGVGLLDERGKSPGRSAWEKILADKPTELICTATDNTVPGGARTVTRHYIGPFTQCDRVEDYRRAWSHFKRVKSEEAI
jgi:hypothetical protein